MSGTRADPDDDVVPVSVRLGEVVPPEDPEDWRRPLTWVAALGMLAAPLAALVWFAAAPPIDGARAFPATFGVAIAVAAGGAATGATQQGAARAGSATLGAGLFAALALVVVGVAMAGERQVGAASPTLAHAFGGAVGGAAGSAGAALVAAVVASRFRRPVRFVLAAAVGAIGAVAVLAALMP